VKQVDEAGRLAASSREAADLAARRANALHAAREEGLAAWLARTALHDGKPCPVCGSTEHPSPATATGRVHEKSEVDDARASATTLESRAAEAESARAREAALLEDLRGRLELARSRESRPTASLREDLAAARTALAAARKAAGRVERLEIELKEARGAVTGARARREAADQASSAARETVAKAEASLGELRRQLDSLGVGPGAHEELRRVREDLALREARADAARKALHSTATLGAEASARRSAADRARERAEKAAAEARSTADAASAAAGFVSLGDCEAALLAAGERKALADSIERRAAAAFAARKRLEDLDAALAGSDRPDVEGAQARRAAAEAAARQAGDEQVRLESEAKRLSDLLTRLGKLRVELDDVAARLSVVGHVAGMVRGRNPRAMSLHRFVLAARLEEVAEAASERLALMSSGRFRLRHDTSVARRNSAAGLSLVVEDTWTGTIDRPVGALSGGESFLASLALALGLSDVVLRHSGGRRLDSLFVDEGFGTLDEATLDVAIQALETLQQSGRLVGVISHVPELRRRIPARIEVTSTDAGAVATVRAG
jgi:exonuclease SbcC